MKNFIQFAIWPLSALVCTAIPATAQEKGVAKFSQRTTSVLMPMVQDEKIKGGDENAFEQSEVLAKIIIEVIDGDGFVIEMEPKRNEWHVVEGMEHVSGRLREALNAAFGSVENVRLKVKTNKIYSDQNRLSLSGPLAVALGASLQGKTMMPGLTVCGDLHSANHISRPHNFWQQLKGLRNSKKEHRVLVAKDTEEDFKQLIALKELEFFILNEVVIVTDLKSAVAASYTGGDKNFLAASKVFAQIQGIAQNGRVNSLVNHPQVKAKLGEVIRLNPNHLSAKMLLIAGERVGARPQFLAAKYAAFEIQLQLDKLKRSIERHEAFHWEDHVRKATAKRLRVVADNLDEELTEVRKYLDGDMKESCDTLRKDIPIALNSWARSLGQKEAEYHTKNCIVQKAKVEKMIENVSERLDRILNKKVANHDENKPDKGFNDDDN